MRHGARAGWFIAAALVTGLLATALGFERLFGAFAQPSLVFDVDVPRDALDVMPAADIERTWRQRLYDHDVRTAPATAASQDSAGVRVTVVGADATDELRVHESLTSGARLALVFVRDGDPTNAQWYQAVQRGDVAAIAPGVTAEPDAWAHEETGREFFDSYLRAESADELDRAIAALEEKHPLPRGHGVAYEHIETRQGERLYDKPYVRTYMLGDELVLTNAHIAQAEVTYSPYTQRPEVLVTLTDDGARRFGDATAENVGRKLAILLDGRVQSAPVIQSAITGGRLSISMGGSDPRQMESDATALAGALGSSLTLPPGVEARLVAKHDRPMGVVWALRLLVGALGGVLALGVAALSARRRWFSRASEVSAGRERWNALAIPALVTFLVPALLWYAAGEVLLPAVNETEMWNLVRDPTLAARATMSVLSLGLAPVTTAFVLVELYAILVEALVPARRGRRLGTPVDRRWLDRAAWILVGVLALVQSYYFALYLENLSNGPVQLLVGDGAKWVVLLSLTTGVMVQIIAAETISRHGLCNGYLVVLASGAAVGLFSLLFPEVEPQFLDPYRPSSAMLGAIAAVAAAATIVSTRVRSGTEGPRLPYTGVVPASLVRGGLSIVTFAAVMSPWLATHLVKVQPWTPLVELAATVPITALILWSTPRPWSMPGVVATLGFLAVLVLLPFTLAEPYRLAAPFAEGVLLGVVAAEIVAGALARVRLPDAVSVLVVHDVDRADRAADRLAAAGIPFALLGVRARAAMRFIGAFAPIAVRVPAARADEAAAIVAPETPAS